jgi:hypothetical protein
LKTSRASPRLLGRFVNDDPVERASLLAALQAEADRRGITLVRVAYQREAETAEASPVPDPRQTARSRRSPIVLFLAEH